MSKGTILIVDDDAETSDMMEMFFQSLDFEVEVFEKAETARTWLATNIPVLIMLDIMMPDGNGLDMCRWIRAQPKMETLPILVNSGLHDEETIQDALENGATDFIPKPHRLDVLKEKVERALKTAG